MRKTITACNLNPHDSTSRLEIDIDLPRICPRCETALSKEPYSSAFFRSGNTTFLYSLFFCPYCEKCFFKEYQAVYGLTHCDAYGVDISTYPFPENHTYFPESIKLLSPKFVEIYRQAESAENNSLYEICGIGYRKALEFLIKDYAISFHPDDSDKIRNEMLSPCITHYIDNYKIQSLAKASAWIGNDETHYIRQHENYNLQHLKLFIASIVSYIDSELSYFKAEALLSTPKK